MLKKLYLCFILICLVSPVFAAGSQEADSSSTETEVIKVAMITPMVPIAEVAEKEYEALNPNVDVQIIELLSSGDLYTKITMMMKSEQTCPDLITEDGFMINEDSSAGFLSPLDGMMSSWEEAKLYDTAILNGAKGVDGKQYGLPFSTDVQCIWYNKDMMRKAGLSVPFEPKNWDEIIETAKKMKAIGGEDFIPLFLYASKNSQEETSMRTFQTLYSGTGSTLYDLDAQKWVCDQANLKKVFSFVDDVYNKEKLGPPLSIAFQHNVFDLFQSDYMKNEKLGMYFSGNWESGNWAEGAKYDWPEGLDVWGVAKIPTITGKAPEYTTMSGGWTWAVPAKASNKKGGEDFLKFISNKDLSVQFSLDVGTLAVRSDVIEDSRYINQDMMVVAESAEMMEYTHFRPSYEGYAALTAMFAEITEAVAIGTYNPGEAVSMFKNEMVRIVGDANVIIK